MVYFKTKTIIHKMLIFKKVMHSIEFFLNDQKWVNLKFA